MKILIVDDNVAVQEIIRDILAERGHIVRLASTVDEAVEKIKSFEPDVVMLDSWVGDEDGMHVVSRTREELPNFDLKVILIKSSSELAPTDNPNIKGWVDKPFKSSDILDAIEDLKVSEAEAVEAEAERKKSRRRYKQARRQSGGGFLHRSKGSKPEPTPDLSESGIEFGRSYVMFEPEPEKVYEFVSSFDTREYGILIVTSDKAKAIKERFSYVSMEVIQLTSSGRAGTMDIQALGSLMVRVQQFIADRPKPVVVFDTFGDIIEANGMNTSLLMLRQLMTGKEGVCTFAVSVDSTPLTDKDRGILLHDMYVYKRS